MGVSFPAAFLLSAVGVVLALPCLYARRWQRLGRLVVAGGIWALSLTALYALQLRHFPENQGLKDLWTDGFMPLAPGLGQLRWFFDRFFDVVSSPTGLSFAGLAGVAFVVGVHTLYKTERQSLAIVLGPVLVALLVSGLRIYPFQGRVLLYLVPIFVLLIAAGAARVQECLAQSLPLAGTAFLAVLLLPMAASAVTHMAGRRPYANPMFPHYTFEETKPVLAYMRSRWQEGDVVYLYSQSAVAFHYYAPRYGFAPADAIDGIEAGLTLRKWSEIQHDVGQLRGRQRVWVFFSHICSDHGVDEERLYLYFLDQMGLRRDTYRPPPGCNAVVYLYDLSSPQPSGPSAAVAKP
jgi:hypothetical protein